MFDFSTFDIGTVHLISALIALLCGSYILFARKGTKLHKQVGYVYTISMTLLNLTAFMIYDLFGGFGIFHYTALLSSLTLMGGMLPLIRRKKGWLYRHFAFMYWSVIGLYAAFASESLTRIPESPFFGMVGIATSVIILLGLVFYLRGHRKWTSQFAKLL